MPSKVYEHEISVSVYSDEKRRFINATEINSRAERQPSFIDGKLATTREWEDQDQQNYRNKIKRSKVEYTDFSEIKPVCVESIDRNRFYKSYNDLAKGSGATVAQIRENYEDWQIEFITVQGIVLKYLNTVVTVK